MTNRFDVREVHGMCVGAGMFVVYDGHEGREVSGYYIDRSAAEQRARRLNIDHQMRLCPHEHAVNDWRLHNSGDAA